MGCSGVISQKESEIGWRSTARTVREALAQGTGDGGSNSSMDGGNSGTWPAVREWALPLYSLDDSKPFPDTFEEWTIVRGRPAHRPLGAPELPSTAAGPSPAQQHLWTSESAALPSAAELARALKTDPAGHLPAHRPQLPLLDPEDFLPRANAEVVRRMACTPLEALRAYCGVPGASPMSCRDASLHGSDGDLTRPSLARRMQIESEAMAAARAELERRSCPGASFHLLFRAALDWGLLSPRRVWAEALAAQGLSQPILPPPSLWSDMTAAVPPAEAALRWAESRDFHCQLALHEADGEIPSPSGFKVRIHVRFGNGAWCSHAPPSSLLTAGSPIPPGTATPAARVKLAVAADALEMEGHRHRLHPRPQGKHPGL